MEMNWQFLINLFGILLTCRTSSVHSIQCCLDRPCSDKVVDCPKNVCFKLEMQFSGKRAEEYGCMDDLINFVLPKKADGSEAFDDNGDSCQNVESPLGASILCKCTSNLCNSSSRMSHLSYPVLIFIFFVIYRFPLVFRR